MSTGVQETHAHRDARGGARSSCRWPASARASSRCSWTRSCRDSCSVRVIVALVVSDTGGFAFGAIVALAVFALLFVYPVAFELGAGGRTPGQALDEPARGLRRRLAADLPVECAAQRAAPRRHPPGPLPGRRGRDLRDARATSASATSRPARSSCASRAPRPSSRRRPRPSAEAEPGRAAGLGRERPARCRAGGAAALPRAPRARSTPCRATCSRAISQTACDRASAASGRTSRPSASSS